MKELFYTYIYTPLYNGLIGVLDLGSWVDMGIAVIILTVLVKFVLFPLSLRAARTQRLMKELEEPMKEIREKYKDDREKQGRELMALYKEKGVNPLSGFLTLFIQIPVILGLYFVFLRGGLPDVDPTLLYSFIPHPESVNMFFLGIIDMAGKSIPLALIAGVSQYFQAHYALPAPKPRAENATFQEDFARSMQMQIKYVLPVFIAGVAYWASAAVALYWITSNIFAIGQELYVERKLDEERTPHE
jgi:YidC/Oxa1 family membrane protein insertase